MWYQIRCEHRLPEACRASLLDRLRFSSDRFQSVSLLIILPATCLVSPFCLSPSISSLQVTLLPLIIIQNHYHPHHHCYLLPPGLPRPPAAPWRLLDLHPSMHCSLCQMAVRPSALTTEIKRRNKYNMGNNPPPKRRMRVHQRIKQKNKRKILKLNATFADRSDWRIFLQLLYVSTPWGLKNTHIPHIITLLSCSAGHAHALGVKGSWTANIICWNLERDRGCNFSARLSFHVISPLTAFIN